MPIEDIWPTPPRVERKYRRAADSVAELLAAGRELLDERGLAPGLGRVSLNDAIDTSEIPRSSAYRLYQGGPDGPLESYRIALLSDVTEDFVQRAERYGPIEEILLAQKATLGERTPESLAGFVREVIRVGVNQTIMSWSTSIEWKATISAVIASSSGDAAHGAEHDMLRAGVLRVVRGALPLYRDLARFGGLRIRDGVEWEEFARVVSAAVEGVAVRNSVDPDLVSIDRPTGPGGAMQTWGAAAIIFEALFCYYFEPDPKASVSADMSGWAR